MPCRWMNKRTYLGKLLRVRLGVNTPPRNGSHIVTTFYQSLAYRRTNVAGTAKYSHPERTGGSEGLDCRGEGNDRNCRRR